MNEEQLEALVDKLVDEATIAVDNPAMEEPKKNARIILEQLITEVGIGRAMQLIARIY